jgi:hypothetical protein
MRREKMQRLSLRRCVLFHHGVSILGRTAASSAPTAFDPAALDKPILEID